MIWKFVSIWKFFTFSRFVFVGGSLISVSLLAGAIAFSNPTANLTGLSQSGFLGMSDIAVQVEPRVRAKLVEHGVADIMVWFRAQASLASLPLERGAGKGEIYRRLVAAAESGQEGLIEILESGDWTYRSFHIVNAINISNADLALIEQIEKLSSVARVDLNFSASLKLPPPGLPSAGTELIKGVETGIRDSGAEVAWTTYKARGQGIVIGSADSGVEWNHPALISKYRGRSPLFVDHNYNWHDAIHSGSTSTCRASSADPCDDTSHGSHTVGTMVGDDGAGNQIGMAPDAKWIGCRNMKSGTGTLATYLECIEFFLAPYPYGGDPKKDGRPDLAPHIVNNSWSCPTSEGCRPGDLVDAMRVMKTAGIAVVVAAGNDGSSCGSLQDPPGTYSGDVISVAAYNRYVREIAYFSSRGPSGFTGGVGIDLAAHGVGIRSSVVGGKYDEKDGTSMAAPHVAGAIALLWSYRPALIGDVDRTVQLLRSTALAKTNGENCGGISGRSIPNTSFGYGMLDVRKLLASVP